jgi:hypothetical protein
MSIGERPIPPSVATRAGLRLPPQAARTFGPPRTRACRMDQSREAHLAARPLHSPEPRTRTGFLGRHEAEGLPSGQAAYLPELTARR